MTTKNDPKRTPTIEASIDRDFLTLMFADGRTLRLSASQLDSRIQGHALMHGLKQKLVDAAAISRNPETGKSATIEDKYDAVREVYDRLLSGEWNKPREGAASAGGLLFRALCELYAGRKSADDVRAYLDGKSDKERAALRTNSRIVPIIERLRAEATPKAGTIDTDALLDELDAE